MRNGRILVSLVLLGAVLFSLTGCESMKKKFTRKRKNAQGPEPIFTLEREYRPEFSPEVRYQAHFAYWKAAHDDLLDDLSERSTRIRRSHSVAQAIKELQSMQELLEGTPVKGLEEVIGQMEKLEAKLDDPLFDPGRDTVTRSQLEALRRRIDKQFDYHKVKADLKPDLSLKSETPAKADAATP